MDKLGQLVILGQLEQLDQLEILDLLETLAQLDQLGILADLVEQPADIRFLPVVRGEGPAPAFFQRGQSGHSLGRGHG